ncbi:MAG TPA: hypothetical protein VFT43_06235, partial [Candidatus Polarisedimenticolia bacterium]|nr:hypothetical protein [Candidatus Polarisedimenticolia bacterium]
MATRPEADDFARRVPKAEIHLHLEGSVDLDTLQAMKRGRGEPPSAAERARLGALYRHCDFPGFLRNFRDLCAEIKTAQDFALITEALSRRLERDAVRYAEVFCSPSIFAGRGLSAGEIMQAVSEAARRREA